MEYAPDGSPDKRCYRVNCDKINRTLPNFRPQWTARTGAQELYEAYRTMGLSAEDLERGRYLRMSHIQRLLQAEQLRRFSALEPPARGGCGGCLNLIDAPIRQDKENMATMVLPTNIQQQAATRRCRFCGTGLQRTFVDLGLSPLCETYPAAADFHRGEVYYPLHVYVCENCFLVQLEEYESAENIFSDYAYFSSYSDSWLKHCETYCNKMSSRFRLNQESFVVEVASNDGYLLQYFVRQNVPVLGIEPAANVAKVAVEKGVPSLVRFFGTELAKELAAEGRCADLVLGNNVLAQVPDLNDFVEGLKILLKPEGVLTLEFPHLLKLIELNEFDTIYHEHFSYFSMLTTVRIMEAHGLKVFDVEELKSHGGSLRVYACRAECATHSLQPNVGKVLADEERAGLLRLKDMKNLPGR